jgi:hypothetical protein
MMAREGLGLAVCSALCLAQVAVGGEAQVREQPNAPWTPPWIAPWVTSAVITSSGDPSSPDSGPVLRVGLKNTSESPRVICVAQSDLFFDGPGIGLGGTSELGNCQARSSFALVLAGQTLFAVVSLEPTHLQSASTDIDLQLRVLESSLDNRTAPRERWLDWGGTVGDALEAGQRLMK